MATYRPSTASLQRRFVQPVLQLPRGRQPSLALQQIRTAAAPSANAAKYRSTSKAQAAKKKKKKAKPEYSQPDLKFADQFALVDAMRYIRAFEVGRAPSSSKYECHVRLRTLKNGPVVRNRFRLPHPVDTSVRICVICAPDSRHARAATAAGAAVVGDDAVFAAVKAGRVEFDRCVAHVDSLQKLNSSGIARILGPRGLMPSAKLGTVVKDVGQAVKDMVGGSEYRERMGVVRMAVGQLAFTPEEMQRNVKAFMDQVKKDCAALSDRISKEVHEVVLSSTNSPGFSLNGDFRSPSSVPTQSLSTS